MNSQTIPGTQIQQTSNSSPVSEDSRESLQRRCDTLKEVLSGIEQLITYKEQEKLAGNNKTTLLFDDVDSQDDDSHITIFKRRSSPSSSSIHLTNKNDNEDIDIEDLLSTSYTPLSAQTPTGDPHNTIHPSTLEAIQQLASLTPPTDPDDIENEEKEEEEYIKNVLCTTKVPIFEKYNYGDRNSIPPTPSSLSVLLFTIINILKLNPHTEYDLYECSYFYLHKYLSQQEIKNVMNHYPLCLYILRSIHLISTLSSSPTTEYIYEYKQPSLSALHASPVGNISQTQGNRNNSLGIYGPITKIENNSNEIDVAKDIQLDETTFEKYYQELITTGKVNHDTEDIYLYYIFKKIYIYKTMNSSPFLSSLNTNENSITTTTNSILFPTEVSEHIKAGNISSLANKYNKNFLDSVYAYIFKRSFAWNTIPSLPSTTSPNPSSGNTNASPYASSPTTPTLSQTNSYLSTSTTTTTNNNNNNSNNNNTNINNTMNNNIYTKTSSGYTANSSNQINNSNANIPLSNTQILNTINNTINTSIYNTTNNINKSKNNSQIHTNSSNTNKYATSSTGTTSSPSKSPIPADNSSSTLAIYTIDKPQDILLGNMKDVYVEYQHQYKRKYELIQKEEELWTQILVNGSKRRENSVSDISTSSYDQEGYSDNEKNKDDDYENKLSSNLKYSIDEDIEMNITNEIPTVKNKFTSLTPWRQGPPLQYRPGRFPPNTDPALPSADLSYITTPIPWSDIASQFTLIPCSLFQPKEQNNHGKSVICPNVRIVSRKRTKGEYVNIASWSLRDPPTKYDKYFKEDRPINKKKRGIAWFNLSGGADLRDEMGEYHYETILQDILQDLSSPDALQIQRDLDRTSLDDCEPLDDEAKEHLFHVLKATAYECREIGYCQSMNLLAAFVLRYQSEEQAFYTLVCLYKNILPDYYSKSLFGMRVDEQVFINLLNQKIPNLMEHLDSLDVDVTIITFHWFLCLFLNTLPIEAVEFIWDQIFYYGSHVIIAVCFRLFNKFDYNLMRCTDLEEIVNLFTSVTDSLDYTIFRDLHDTGITLPAVRVEREKFSEILKEESEITPVPDVITQSNNTKSLSIRQSIRQSFIVDSNTGPHLMPIEETMGIPSSLFSSTSIIPEGTQDNLQHKFQKGNSIILSRTQLNDIITYLRVYISKQKKDLTSLEFCEKGMDKLEFLAFWNDLSSDMTITMPLNVFEDLFNDFKRSKDDRVDIRQVVSAFIYTIDDEDIDNRLLFFFNVYDLDSKNYLSKQDLKDLISTVYSMYPSIAGSPIKDIDISINSIFALKGKGQQGIAFYEFKNMCLYHPYLNTYFGLLFNDIGTKPVNIMATKSKMGMSIKDLRKQFRSSLKSTNMDDNSIANDSFMQMLPAIIPPEYMPKYEEFKDRLAAEVDVYTKLKKNFDDMNQQLSQTLLDYSKCRQILRSHGYDEKGNLIDTRDEIYLSSPVENDTPSNSNRSNVSTSSSDVSHISPNGLSTSIRMAPSGTANNDTTTASPPFLKKEIKVHLRSSLKSISENSV
ncbi:hypothetical protein WA158_006746 [Blastocystis sp. Blastoise]